MAGNNTKIRGITIDLGLDTSGISSGLKEVQKSLASTQRSLKDVDKLLKLDPKNTELLSQKQGYLSKAIDDTKKKIEQEERALKELETAGNSDKTLEQQNALKRDIEATRQSLTQYEGELEDTNKALDGYTDEIQDATQGTQQFDATAQLLARKQLGEIFNKMGEGAKTLAKNALSAAKELDAGYDTIIRKTGATGEAFDDLKAVADSVYGSMPSEMSDVGSAVGELNTRFKVSGDELEGLTRDFLQFSDVTGADVSGSISSVDKIMKAFGVDVADTGNVLGYLTRTSQETGIATDRLMSSLEGNGAVFRSLGFSLEDSVSLLAQFEANGVDASGAATALKKAVQNAAKEGKDAGSVLRDAGERIKNAKTETEALQIATETFGSKGAIVMADAIQSGRIAFDEASKSIKDYGNVVSETYEETLSPWDKTQQTMQNLKRVGSELAGQALATLQPAIEKVAGFVKGLSERFERLHPRTKKVIGVITALAAGAAILGPKLGAVIQLLNSFRMASTIAKSVGLLSAAQTANATATEGAAIAQTHLNAAMNANIILAVVAAILALVAAIATLKGRADRASKTTEDLVKRSKDAAAAYEEEKKKINETATPVDELIDKMEKLQAKEELSAEEKLEMAAAYDELTRAVPDLNLQLDKQTGKLADSTGAIIENTDALKDNLRTAKERYEAERKQQQTDAAYENFKAQRDVMQGLADEAEKLQAEYDEINSKNTGSSTDVGRLIDIKNALDLNAQSYAAAEEAASKAESEYNSLIETTYGLKTATDSQTGSVQQQIPVWQTLSAEQQTTAQNVAQAYYDMRDAVSQSIQQQISWLDEYKKAEDLQASDLVQNLKDQKDAVEEWEQNLQILADRGINQGFLQYLADMGPKGAAYVKAFVDDSGEALSEVNTLWPEVIDYENFENQTATNLSTSVTRAAAGGLAAFGDLADSLGARGIEAGEMTGAGLVQGIESAINSGEAANAAERLGDDTIEGLAVDGLGENSPSRPARTAGVFVGAGLRLGLIAGKIPVHNAAVSLGNEADMQKVMPNAQAKARNFGFNISAGLAGGILNGKSLVIRAATEAAQAAITAAMQTLKINSPSRVFAWIGQMSGEGFGQGWNRSMRDVTATIRADMSALADYRPETIDADSVYNAIRSGAGDAQPVIYLDGRQITRGLKGLGVSFG